MITQEMDKHELNEELSKFNFGAFGLGIIWAIFNNTLKQYWPFFVGSLILFFLFGRIPFIGFFCKLIALLGIPIYVGIQGNRWAWESKKWNHIDDFTEIQKNWAKGTVVFFIFLPFILIGIAGNLLKKSINDGSIDSFATMAIVRGIVEQDILSKCNDGADIVRELKKMDNGQNIAVDNKDNENEDETNEDEANEDEANEERTDTITIASKKDKNFGYILKFYKNGSCSLKRKNCYIDIGRKTSSYVKPSMRTYFDDKGNMKHTKLKRTSF